MDDRLGVQLPVNAGKRRPARREASESRQRWRSSLRQRDRRGLASSAEAVQDAFDRGGSQSPPRAIRMPMAVSLAAMARRDRPSATHLR